jgi:hypothetical protein
MQGNWRIGQEVRAFHPAMFGVVLTGTIVRIGRKYLTVDFGPIRGGAFRIFPEDVVG